MIFRQHRSFGSQRTLMMGHKIISALFGLFFLSRNSRQQEAELSPILQAKLSYPTLATAAVQQSGEAHLSAGHIKESVPTRIPRPTRRMKYLEKTLGDANLPPAHPNQIEKHRGRNNQKHLENVAPTHHTPGVVMPKKSGHIPNFSGASPTDNSDHEDESLETESNTVSARQINDQDYSGPETHPPKNN